MRKQRNLLVEFGRLVVAALFVASVASGTFVSIRPIQVCANGGVNCADPTRELFELAGDTIWAQASIDLVLLPWNTYSNSSFLYIDDNSELTNLFYSPGTGYDPDSTVISMWFVNNLNALVPAGTVFGASVLNGNRIAIADATFAQNRLDTIAHEIGHALGLPHYTGANTQLHLMADGSSRITPASVMDIYPNAPYLDQLTSGDIAQVYQSPLLHDATVVPEPWSMFLTGGGLLLLALGTQKKNGS